MRISDWSSDVCSSDLEAFSMADEVLQQGVRGITDLMVMPGLINLDFADVRSVMREMGKAMMGTGEAEGDGRALEAAQKARSEEHTSELPSLMRISYAVFCLKKKINNY